MPDRWAKRGVPVVMVPLLPGEAADVLLGEKASPALPLGEETLVRLVARGLSAPQIARELGVSLRSAYRRLATLRQQFGVSSTAELAIRLSGRGF